MDARCIFCLFFFVFISDHFTAKLSVRMTSGPDFVATNFTFFDCNTYSSCTQCVSSSFPCDWCVDGHRCTHDTAENCRNDILVTGVSVRSSLIRMFHSCFVFFLLGVVIMVFVFSFFAFHSGLDRVTGQVQHSAQQLMQL